MIGAKMMKIYRVQDKHGAGPFVPGITKKWLTTAKDLPPFYLTWPETLSPAFRRRVNDTGFALGCGCLTKDQLKLWFTETEYKKLLRLSFESVEIDADEVLLSDEIQCVFCHSKSFKKSAKKFNLYDI